MNDFDRENLEFFINASSSEFDDWAEQAADDDLQYAINLIRQARRELLEQELQVLDSVEDTQQAQEILKQFTLASK